jgi:small subunit ribosomal protein S23
MTKDGAYDQARKEFYAERLQQEVEMRVAKEEALATSAYFGKSRVQISGELEDHNYEAWRRKANEDFVALEQKRASAISSSAPSAEAETPADEPEVTQEAVDTLNEESENKQGG